jgi:uncharacterized flavoprotein (TIGR03862 family)
VSLSDQTIAIIGAGPAGLMAAEVLSHAGLSVHVFDAMPSVGRKFLLAGLGGLNLTHAEPIDTFVTRFGARRQECASWMKAFDNQAIREWAHGLGVDTFVGSSQRVFPTDMKAAPLLRAWLHRLRHPAQGVPVTFHMRHRWNGQMTPSTGNANGFSFTCDTPNGTSSFEANAMLLALGGGSWARLGSDGAWQEWLKAQHIDIAPLRPSNCGFDVQGGWSEFFATRFAGSPLKSVAIEATDANGHTFKRKGEFVITQTGVQGSLIYAASALLREEIARVGSATFSVNLRPDLSPERVLAEVSHPRGSKSLSSHLKSRLNLSAVHTTLLHEVLSKAALADVKQVAHAISHLPLSVSATRPIDEAISTAGGVRLEDLNEALMVKAQPGLFMAGEMLDWEAPTGGYLLSACLASGRVAANGILDLLVK